MNGDSMTQESHLSDQALLLAADGELPLAQAAQVGAHLSGCWSCRARKQEIEEAIIDFVRLHRGDLDPLLPPPAGPRALLKARLAEFAAVPQPWWTRWSQHIAWRGAWKWAWRPALAALLFAAGATGFHSLISLSELRPAFRSVPVSFPEASLTPGAVVSLNREQVCDSAQPKNRIVPASLRRKVFEEYGIPSAEPRAYEVDYLITPALGGADDIRNLWPQSYSSAVWNARVKDALEDRLHDLVCAGSLDLVAAQHDISSDWIAAYKKYFHTDRPLETAPEKLK
jgi:anti-sigma factor RsiW